MSGGGGAKKFVIGYMLDYPVRVYLGGAAALWAIRRYKT